MVASAAEMQEATTLLGRGNIQNMKRAQLQKLCKQFGLKASGKVRLLLYPASLQKIIESFVAVSCCQCTTGTCTV